MSRIAAEHAPCELHILRAGTPRTPHAARPNAYLAHFGLFETDTLTRHIANSRPLLARTFLRTHRHTLTDAHSYTHTHTHMAIQHEAHTTMDIVTRPANRSAATTLPHCRRRQASNDHACVCLQCWHPLLPSRVSRPGRVARLSCRPGVVTPRDSQPFGGPVFAPFRRGLSYLSDGPLVSRFR